MAERIYDVIILGASGFTGKYVIREALKFHNSPNSPLKSLALAGRRPSRLSDALKWAAGSNLPPNDIPLLTADTSDPSSLARLAAQAKVILNCVGPFGLYGEPVVAMCVEHGCDYLDITGEPEFMKRMETSYHEKAAEGGALVVSACGFDSIPAEMGFLFHSRQWSGTSAPNRVEVFVKLESDRRICVNFGTYESAVVEAANANKLEMLGRSGPRRVLPQIPGTSAKGLIIEHQEELGVWGIKVPSPDCIAVERTLSMLAENPHGLPGINESVENAKQREAFWASVKPAHFGVKFGTKSMLRLVPAIILGILFALLSQFSVGRWLLLRFPSFFSMGVFRRNAGPSEEEVASASFTMWFVGQGYSDVSLASKGKKKADTEVITRVTGPESGYVTTPICLVQCALAMLSDRNNLPKGGVYSPGIVFGATDLEKRLQENGISFDFISKKVLSS